MASTVAASAVVPKWTTPISANIIDLVVADHNKVRSLYDALMVPTLPLDKRFLAAWQLISEFSSDAFKKELVFYPAVRLYLGDTVADRALTRVQTLKLDVNQLDNLVAASDPLGGAIDMSLVQTVSEAVQSWMADEEADLLPALDAALTADEKLEMGLRFNAAQAKAPTKAHPELLQGDEVAAAATKQTDLAMDQASIPAVTDPSSVGPVPPAPMF